MFPAKRTIILLTLPLALAACGGDDDDDGGTDVDAAPGVDAGADASPVGPVVTIEDGDLLGSLEGETRRFLGIPFARPPVGDLRWKAPVPNDPWEGVREATAFGGACAQLASLQGPMSEEEDCLYLNVWTPEPAPSKPLPVMVWLHGGGNQNGAASDEVPLGGSDGYFYDGRALAERYGVVVVTTNYRLGLFGFFAHPQLTDEKSPLGNQGLLDQRRALEWVQTNIAAFGGDPESVTIFGESAGSLDVCLHVASGAAGFHRAISQSGGCTTRMATAEEAATGIAAFVEAVGCAEAADALACLRAKPTEELLIDVPLDGGPKKPLPGGPGYQGATPRWSFNPVVDGGTVPDQPRFLFDGKLAADVPYILGSNTDEGTLFHLQGDPVMTEPEYLAALERRFGDLADEVAEVYPVANFATPQDALMRVTGDIGLVCGTHDTARRAAAAGLAVWMYNFDFPIVLPGLAFLGATHGAEIAFVFDSVPNDAQATVGEPLRGYWTRLAQKGDPNGESAVDWPPFSAEEDVRVNLNTTVTVRTDFRATECAFWRDFHDDAF